MQRVDRAVTGTRPVRCPPGTGMSCEFQAVASLRDTQKCPRRGRCRSNVCWPLRVPPSPLRGKTTFYPEALTLVAQPWPPEARDGVREPLTETTRLGQ